MARKEKLNVPKILNAKNAFLVEKKDSTVKNVILCGLLDQQVKYLSPTHEGKKHDKKIADEERIQVPADSDLYQDTGFQGFAVSGVNMHQPKKKPKGENLTTGDKIIHRIISRTRVEVEHVIAGIKRLHIVKHVFRNIQDDREDQVMFLACGLHNFRRSHRLNY